MPKCREENARRRKETAGLKKRERNASEINWPLQIELQIRVQVDFLDQRPNKRTSENSVQRNV